MRLAYEGLASMGGGVDRERLILCPSVGSLLLSLPLTSLLSSLDPERCRPELIKLPALALINWMGLVSWPVCPPHPPTNHRPPHNQL